MRLGYMSWLEQVFRFFGDVAIVGGAFVDSKRRINIGRVALVLALVHVDSDSAAMYILQAAVHLLSHLVDLSSPCWRNLNHA